VQIKTAVPLSKRGLLSLVIVNLNSRDSLAGISIDESTLSESFEIMEMMRNGS
jgi:hypothetical protein